MNNMLLVAIELLFDFPALHIREIGVQYDMVG